MIVLENVLSAEELQAVRAALDEVEFIDGKVTASGAAAEVKRNLQAAREHARPAPLDELIIGALTRHERLSHWALPRQFAAPVYSRYEPGMEYGPHTDAPLMGQPPIRTDVSITLFLSPPDDYDGGELQIEAETGALQIKLPAGHAVAYNTNALHQVRPVTRGIRLVAVTWAQSYLPDEGLRRILLDLHTALVRLRADRAAAVETRLIEKSYNNLLRRSISP